MPDQRSSEQSYGRWRRQVNVRRGLALVLNAPANLRQLGEFTVTALAFGRDFPVATRQRAPALFANAPDRRQNRIGRKIPFPVVPRQPEERSSSRAALQPFARSYVHHATPPRQWRRLLAARARMSRHGSPAKHA